MRTAIGAMLLLTICNPLSAAEQQQADTEVVTTTGQFVPLEPFTIPDEFAPAVIPYLDCVTFSAGLPVRRNGQLLEPTIPKGASCSNQREKAASQIESTLERAGERSADERRARVDAFLSEVDRRFGVAPARMSLQVPSEIGAELRPYIKCRMSGAACLSERFKAIADAEAALVQKRAMSSDERKSFVAHYLDSVDAVLPSAPSNSEK